MKTKNFFILLLLVACVTACEYDDGALWDKVNALEQRIKKMEEQIKEMNSNLDGISTTVSALQNKVYVESVKNESGTWVITFSNGEIAKITNGKDGENAPVISIAEENGTYYWQQTTSQGASWLLDKAGEKIPVAGVTPQLRVDGNGYWEISYDKGTTFTQMKDSSGNPVKAVGSDGVDGDSFFSDVRFDSNELTLVLKNGDELVLPITSTGVPSDVVATANPTVDASEINTAIPNFSSPIVEEGTNRKVARLSLTGIQTPDNKWLQLFGTGNTGQNIWIEIDGKPKSIAVINSREVKTRSSVVRSLAQADIIFLVDNSGSMSEEAEAVAREIKEWATLLSQTMDVKFGCVGYDGGFVSGALNITDVSDLSNYLNRTTGVRRTYGYGGPDATTLQTEASAYRNGSSGECGAMALRFADLNFTFRPGSNRIYVNMTDEPNQPNGHTKWSVESVNSNSEYYDWNTARGTIHTVFSDLTSYPDTYNWKDLYREKPWLMSTYTGGTHLPAPSDFSGITLESLPVTGAITNSYIIRFNVTPELLSGKHTVKITIVSTDGTVKAEKVFEDVEFA